MQHPYSLGSVCIHDLVGAVACDQFNSLRVETVLEPGGSGSDVLLSLPRWQRVEQEVSGVCGV